MTHISRNNTFSGLYQHITLGFFGIFLEAGLETPLDPPLVCVCVHVYVSPKDNKNHLCEMKPIKQSQFLYMTLTIKITDECGLSNKACHEFLQEEQGNVPQIRPE